MIDGAQLPAVQQLDGRREMDRDLNVQSLCVATGQIFRRPITGVFSKEPESTLQERKKLLEEKLHEINGCRVQHKDGLALALQVEYLEILLDFEINPPCGCAPPELPEGFYSEW